MVGWNKIGHFRELINYRELLNHVVELNDPHTNSPQLHVVHKNPIESSTRGTSSHQNQLELCGVYVTLLVVKMKA